MGAAAQPQFTRIKPGHCRQIERRALIEDLNDPETASRRGAAGRAYVLAQHGAANRTLAELDRLVEAATASTA